MVLFGRCKTLEKEFVQNRSDLKNLLDTSSFFGIQNFSFGLFGKLLYKIKFYIELPHFPEKQTFRKIV